MKKSTIQWAALLFGAAFFAGCSNDDSFSGTDGENAELQLKVSGAEEANWSHTLFLFQGGNLLQTKTGASAVFSVEQGLSYTLKALVVSDAAALTMPSPLTGVNDQLQVKNMANVPEILFGASDPTLVSGNQTITVNAERIVSRIAFNVTGTLTGVTSIRAEVSGLNDRVTLDGTGSASAQNLKKSLTLTASGNAFVGDMVVLPSTAKTLQVTYFVTLNGATQEIASTVNAPNGLLANETTRVNTTISEPGRGTYVNSSIIYESWAAGKTVIDNGSISVPEQPVKTAIALTASMFSTNNPMQYVTFGFTADGDWSSNSAITTAQRTARENKWGKFANLFDNNPATGYSTNFDMYKADNSWNMRPDVFVAYNHIQIDLGAGNEIFQFDIELQNIDKGECLKKVDYQVSSNGTNFITVASVGEDTFNKANGAVNKSENVAKSDNTAFRYIRIVAKDGATTVGSFYDQTNWVDRYAGYFGVAEIKLWKIN